MTVGKKGNNGEGVLNGYIDEIKISGLSNNTDEYFNITPKSIVLWRFNSNGNTVLNEVSDKYQCILLGMSGTVTGKYGKAIRLGDNSYAETSYDSALFPQKKLKIEAIIKVDRYPTIDEQHSMIVSSCTWDPPVGYELRLNPDGKMEISVGDGVTDDKWYHLSSKSIVPLNRWSEVSGEYTGNELIITVDGISDTMPYTGDIHPSNYPLCIGKRPVDRPFYFFGQVDEVRITGENK